MLKCLTAALSLPLNRLEDKYDTLRASVDKLRLLVAVVHYDVGSGYEFHDVWRVLLGRKSPNVDTRQIITRPARVAVPLTMVMLIISRLSLSLLEAAEGLLTTGLT